MVGYYERLSYLDNSFLALESRTTHMHVAGLAVFEAGPLKTDSGGIDIERIRAHVGSKLHLIERYRQRLAWVPIERHPVWVDDDPFHLEYHVRHASLPRPGTFDQLREFMARIVSQQLDRTKPLWELYVVEGLEGDRFALISKMHHAMIDGIAGIDLMAVLLNFGPQDEIEDAPPYSPRPVPTGTELVVLETLRRAQRVAAAARSVRRLVHDVQDVAFQGARRLRAVTNSLSSGWLSFASKTPLNGEITPVRRFQVMEVPLAEVKKIKNGLNGTVNDAVLAIVAGGVRRFLEKDRGFSVEDLDFRVMAPVSVRTDEERGTMGNQIAMWLVAMPVDEPDPAERFAAVSRETENLKMTDQALGAATLVRLSAGAPATLVSLAIRGLAAGVRPFNMTVTNVPGPQFPLFLLGAKMVGSYPLVPLWQGHGVGVAIFSYDGTLYWGINADYDVVPDVERFADALHESFEELLDTAAAMPEPAAEERQREPKQRPPLGTRSAPNDDGSGSPNGEQSVATSGEDGAGSEEAGEG